MKHFLFFIFTIIFFNISISQIEDHIKYKQQFNSIYLTVFDSSNYKLAIKKISYLEKKFKKLYTEEYILKAYCYHKLGNDFKASKSIKLAWSNHLCDPSTLKQINNYEWVKMVDGFNKIQTKRMHKGFENNKKLNSQFLDTLNKLTDTILYYDQYYRSLLVDVKNDSIETYKLHVKIQFQDSLNIIKFKEIYSKYGFPGEKISCFFSEKLYVFLLHSADYDWFLDEYSNIFYNDVINGNMPATLYLIWLDRNKTSKNEKVQFAMYGNPRKFIATKEEIEEIKNQRLKFGVVNSFRIPYELRGFQ
jgi:hypothetical protein